ncbi:hypothetical protein DNTS_029959 [Danionella cerebrum]|uniref:Uncharacterized protein n=1 Tax=Danionella cerebrum TaxID=2873325 RepID=A0A553PXR2_9TELE|nr:hypothetical protein DNTS_029959 [Danionella translucida]
MRVVLLAVVPDRRVQCLARGLVVLIAPGEPAACYTGNSGAGDPRTWNCCASVDKLTVITPEGTPALY